MLDYLNQVIGTEQRYVCVSRPRRFGKSIAARMAAAYYSRGCRSEALFSKYEIAKSRDFNTMISPKRLAKYAGFTEDEVRSLCRQYDMNFSEAQRWYDGYGFRSIKHIYCPNSVANAMFDGEFNSYWTGTVAYESL